MDQVLHRRSDDKETKRVSEDRISQGCLNPFEGI